MEKNVQPTNPQETLLVNFAAAFASGEAQRMHSLIDTDIIAFVTNDNAELDKIEGADNFMRRIESVDYSGVNLQIQPTQLITLNSNQVMGMFHVTAHKKGIDFENFGAFLCYTKNNKITHFWMLDAKPNYSDEFWKK
jgi:hypothetical protein